HLPHLASVGPLCARVCVNHGVPRRDEFLEEFGRHRAFPQTAVQLLDAPDKLGVLPRTACLPPLAWTFDISREPVYPALKPSHKTDQGQAVGGAAQVLAKPLLMPNHRIKDYGILCRKFF